jgi:hypothetical protein
MNHFQGRDVAVMSPGERLDALAAILAIGYEKWAQIQQIELDEVRKRMLNGHAVNGQRPAAGDQSND